jgi:hypothetical protein
MVVREQQSHAPSSSGHTRSFLIRPLNQSNRVSRLGRPTQYGYVTA